MIRKMFLSAVTALALGSSAGAEMITSHGYNFLADLKYPADFAHFDYVNPDAPKGGEISIWSQGSFDNFNRWAMQGNTPALIEDSLESLMIGTADENGSYYGLIAETVTYDSDLTEAIFTLRPEAQFSDGSPITAADVVFTHELFKEQAIPSYRDAVAEIITSVEALDPHRVRFTFNPDSRKRGRVELAAGSPVMSKAWFEKTGARLDEPSDVPFLTSGPYQVESFDYSRQIVYARNPDYWGRDLPINRGRHNFDRIRVEYFGDSNVAFEAFKAGEYTFRQENSSIVWATQYDFPALDAGHVIRAELPDGNVPSASGWIFNMRLAKFQDARVREAIGLAFNPQWTNETLQYGLFGRLNSFFQGSDVEAKGVAEGEEREVLEGLGKLIDQSLIDAPVTELHKGGPRQANRRDLGRASQLLDAAGWIVGSDGVRRNEAGEALSVEFLASSPTFDRITLPFVENLKAIGVDASYARIDRPQYVQRVRDSEFDMFYMTYPASDRPGGSLEQYYGTDGVEDSNYAGLSDPAIDAVLTRLVNATTEDGLIAATKALDRLLRAKRFMVLSWFNDSYWLAYYDMFRHPETLPPYALGNLDWWWFDEAAYQRLRAEGVLR